MDRHVDEIFDLLHAQGLLEDPQRLVELQESMVRISALDDSLRATIDFVGGIADLGENERVGPRALGYVE